MKLLTRELLFFPKGSHSLFLEANSHRRIFRACLGLVLWLFHISRSSDELNLVAPGDSNIRSFKWPLTPPSRWETSKSKLIFLTRLKPQHQTCQHCSNKVPSIILPASTPQPPLTAPKSSPDTHYFDWSTVSSPAAYSAH